MPFFAGFDIEVYPKIDMMNWLHTQTNMTWCAFYLAPAPNRSDTGWPGNYAAIKDSWGVAPVYVGQQDPATATPNYTPSSKLTAAQGAIDGLDAANLAAAEPFPDGTHIYLDWEQGNIIPAAADYITAWIQAVVAQGHFMPGVYCSHNAVDALVALIDNINPTPSVRVWCWKLAPELVGQHPFLGDIHNIPELDPTGCGFAAAVAWQREQDAIVTFPPDAPTTQPLQMDFSTASMTDPGAPGL